MLHMNSTSLFPADLRHDRSISRAWSARKVVAGVALLALAPAAIAQGVCFAPAGTASTGSLPDSIEIADFDGDGRPDLAVTSGGNTISVLRNLGGGAFAAQVQYVVGSGPSSLVAADFDVDGDLDLAVSNLGSETISVLQNQGSGTFVLTTTLAPAGTPREITSADVNGDGAPDLLVADHLTAPSTDRVSVFLGLGGGAFAPRVSYTVDDRPFWLATADLDGDGDLDVASANSLGRSMSILFNHGGGTFAPQVSTPLSKEASSIAAGDMNGDGAIDLVVTASELSPYAESIFVFLNAGGGTFQPAVEYPTATSPHSVRCADVNGDGLLDVVDASYGSTAAVRLNLGNGVLGPQNLYSAGGASYCLDVADLDGDGRLDLAIPVITQARVQVLLNCGAQPGVLFCSGDGTGTPCPCGNSGVDGSGCAQSQFGNGGSLAAMGTASLAADTVVLNATSVSNVVFFQGTTRQAGGAGVVFGDGKLCVGGTTLRLGTKTAIAGAAQYPEPADHSISVRGAVTVPGTRTYQGWFRNVANYCTPAAFNLTNGYEIAWAQ